MNEIAAKNPEEKSIDFLKREIYPVLLDINKRMKAFDDERNTIFSGNINNNTLNEILKKHGLDIQELNRLNALQNLYDLGESFRNPKFIGKIKLLQADTTSRYQNEKELINIFRSVWKGDFIKDLYNFFEGSSAESLRDIGYFVLMLNLMSPLQTFRHQIEFLTIEEENDGS